MPIVHIEVLEGRDGQQLQAAMSAVTDAVVGSLSVRPDQVRVLVSEVPPTLWAVAGEPVQPAKP